MTSTLDRRIGTAPRRPLTGPRTIETEKRVATTRPTAPVTLRPQPNRTRPTTSKGLRTVAPHAGVASLGSSPPAPAALAPRTARVSGPVFRDDAAALTGLSISTVNRQVSALLQAGLIRERADLTPPGAVGRPRVPFEINTGDDPQSASTSATAPPRSPRRPASRRRCHQHRDAAGRYPGPSCRRDRCQCTTIRRPLGGQAPAVGRRCHRRPRVGQGRRRSSAPRLDRRACRRADRADLGSAGLGGQPR